MKNLSIAKDLSFPIDIVTNTIAILAKRRAGKSYTMRRIAEQLLEAKQQVVLVDPKGDQWGIRSSADGKKPGYPVIILGGEHADVPLEVNAGEMVAKLVVEERVSIVLDLSTFRKHEIATFMQIFLENIYRLKAQEKYRTPVMIITDEADAIAPQKPQKGEERMLGAIEDIVRRGGQRGIGCILVTQRSAVLNKNVLTQAQMLIVLRTIAPQDLAAMKAWIDVHGTPEQGKELIESLPSLPIGDAWFWSPGWPTEKGIFKRAHVLPITTFDSGATPKPGERKVIPKTAADVDLDALKKQMAATIEKAKAEDPKELRKKISDLEKQLKNSDQHGELAFGEIERRVDQAIKETEKRKDIEFMAERDEFIRHLNTMFKVIESIGRMVKDIKMPDLKARASKTKQYQSMLKPVVPPSIVKHVDRPADVHVSSPVQTNGDLQAGELLVLKAVAQLDSSGITRPHITALTGYKKSTRDRYLLTLKSRGYVRDEGGKIFVEQAGIDFLGPDFDPLPIGRALQDHLLRTLPAGEGKILKALVDVYPEGLDRESITEATGYQKSTRDRYLLYLAARELVDTSQKGFVVASEKLFE